MRLHLISTCLAILLATPALAAAAPGIVPVQGFLTDATGAPITGAPVVRISLYTNSAADEADHVYRESQSVSVDSGHFTLLVGTVTSLDLALFRDHPALFVGIKVGADPEMMPRLTLGTTPYAGFAEHAGDANTLRGQPPSDFAASGDAVPAGAVMYFDLATCPAGWSALAAAGGRTLVGVPTGGMVGGTTGTPLGNLEVRNHTHMVDPDAVTSSMDGAHTHPVPTGSVFIPAGGSHQHTIDIPDATAASSTHRHDYAVFDNFNKDWLAYTASGATTRTTIVDWGTTTEGGIHADGGGQFPLEWDANLPGAGGTLYTGDSSHGHTVPFTAFNTPSGEGPHTHSFDPPDLTAQSAGAHGHQVDVGSTITDPAATTMPYVQLLVCRKN